MEDAEFSYERAEGFVAYDPTLTSVEEIIAELKRMTGFDATAREGVQGDQVRSDETTGGPR